MSDAPAAVQQESDDSYRKRLSDACKTWGALVAEVWQSSGDALDEIGRTLNIERIDERTQRACATVDEWNRSHHTANRRRREVMDESKYEGWTILELMGHRRLGGFVREVQVAGAGFLRIDVPMENGPDLTQFYPPASVYAITPTTEEMARAVAKWNRPQPVNRWELPSADLPADDPAAEIESHVASTHGNDDDPCVDGWHGDPDAINPCPSCGEEPVLF